MLNGLKHIPVCTAVALAAAAMVSMKVGGQKVTNRTNQVSAPVGLDAGTLGGMSSLEPFLGGGVRESGNDGNLRSGGVATVTPEDVTNGYRLVEETMECAIVPPGAYAVTNDLWLKRGAYDTVFSIPATNWSFRVPDGEASKVMVYAYGELRMLGGSGLSLPQIFEDKVSLVPTSRWDMLQNGADASFFCHEATPSNSLVVTWRNALLGRDTASNVTFQAEFFTGGDFEYRYDDRTLRYRVVTAFDWDDDGLANEVDPEPYANNGDCYGQAEGWVSACFTNAAEILSVGYPQWVDSQVGSGLTNGLFKLTAVFDQPPSVAVRLAVGNFHVVVTNVGEYVFLLEKGEDYEYGTLPFVSNVTYSAVDDIGPQLRQETFMGAVGEWTIDGGYGSEPQTNGALGRVWWMPTFFGAPGYSHLWPGDSPWVFSANFLDYRTPPAATYLWTASEGLSVVSPNSQTTEVVGAAMPSWGQSSLSVSAMLGGHTLVSYLEGLTYGTNDTPQLHLSFALPRIVFTDDSIVHNGKRRPLSLSFGSDVPTNGIVALRWISGADRISLWTGDKPSASALGKEYQWDARLFSFFSCYVSGDEESGSVGDVVAECRFVPQAGEVTSITQSLTVAHIHHSTVSEIPANMQRTELGAAEELRFAYRPDGILCNASCSSGSVSPPAFGDSLFTAPDTGCVSTVSFDALDMPLDYSFTIVEPSGIAVSQVDETNYLNPGYSGLIELAYHLRVLPTNVSFYALEFCELDRPATNVWGYYAQPSMASRIQHNGAGKWGGVGYDNSDVDHVRSGYNPPPWQEGGGFRWPIPLVWRTRNGNGEIHVLTNYFQRFELDPDGTTRVSKFGWCYERTTNCVFNVYERSDDE